MQFKDIIGQQKIKESLIQTVRNNRISHAQLFLGPEGAGSLSLAIAYSQYINCMQPTEMDSCGICSSCVKFQKLVHPDLHFSFPTVTGEKYKNKKTANDFLEYFRPALLINPDLTDLQWLLTLDEDGKRQGNITADECRDMIRKLGLKPYEAQYKTLIIWLPEYMGNEGNILLKLLEEPPLRTLIILVAQDSEKVIGTILSRTQLLKIPRLKDEDIITELIQQYQLSENEAGPLARVAEGNISLARSLADTGRSDYHELFAAWMRFTYQKKLLDLNPLIEQIVSTGKEFMKSFLAYSLQMMRAVMLSKFANDSMIKLSDQETSFVKKFASVFETQKIADICAEMSRASYSLERNADARLTFLNLSLYISRRLVKPKG
jgi:DNA polymerase-3 subunit delta'